MKKLIVSLFVIAAFLHITKLGYYLKGLYYYYGHTTNTKVYPLYETFTVSGQAVRGLVITVHGMNVIPSKMDSFSTLFQEKGFEVYRTALSGHRGGVEETLSVTKEAWEQDLERVYQDAKKRQNEVSAPIYCLGFSMGALMLVDAQVNHKINCQRIVLLAPALTTFTPKWLVDWASRLLPKGPLFPSVVPVEYRLHDSFSIVPNKAMFDAMWALQQGSLSSANIPGLMIMDPQDELVSFEGNKKFLHEKGLENWKIEEVSTEKTSLVRPIHHLIIDESSLGKEEWNRMTSLILKFWGTP